MIGDDKGKVLSWNLEGDLPEEAPVGVRSILPAEMGVAFQPIVSIASGRVLAHEVLARCKRPEYKNPMVLFEHAVKEQACGPLGRLIRDAAFATCGDVSLFVNLHPEELASRWLVQPDDPIGFHSRPVYLEITETAALSHYDVCMRVVNELCRRTHALLVIDDFGAGYSNLERVVDLAPAFVKLDLALVRGIHEQRRKQIVVRHVVNLCGELGAKVVAEGVETIDELACVRDLGVGYAQGYLLARPAAEPPVHSWPFPTTGITAPPKAVSIRARASKPPERASKPPPSRKSGAPRGTKPPRG